MAAFSVNILWGSSPDPDAKPCTYSFDTEKELDAFLYGVDEGAGWMDYEVVDEE